MVASTDGSPTWTGWKRRSRAASFSTCLRYSSRVVAPIMRSSPRASMGLSMLEASIDPSAAPAPTTVCISSMKVMTWPSASVISLRTAFSRSSNSPRYLEPATIEPRSSATMRRSFEAVGDVAFDDAPGQALDDGGLAHAGLADEDRVVLGAAGEDLDDAADLLVAADDRVELALAGHLGEVAAVLLQGLVAVLGGLAGDPVAASDVAQDGEQVLTADASESLGVRVARASSRCSVDRYSSLSVGALAVGGVEEVPGVAAQLGLGPAVGLGQPCHPLLGLAAQRRRRDAGPLEDGEHDAVLLAQQGQQDVVGRDLGVAAGAGQLEGGRQRLLGLDRPAVGVQRHVSPLLTS